MKETALPMMLSFSAPNLREQIEALPDGTALIGISTDGRAIAVDLDAECPHVLICTSTGGGSTTVLRLLTAQFLHEGAHALVLDPKRISHLWARGLPSVTHRGTVADIHDALVGLGGETARRLTLTDTELAVTPRLIVSMDSANSTLRQLTRYWETFRDKDDPHTSPAVTALEAALRSGRTARVHILLDGPPASSILGAAPHELFGTVVLARVSTTTLQRLAPVTDPAPKPSKHRGHGHVIQHGEVHETRAVWMTDADVVTWLTDSDNTQS
ncbi:hypothetical protein [Streptomyces longispororuber]|uniref:hypothetical protein n=1 Tax=Streptomyces longispororuber TaxID=68230 RepID=UPI0036FA2366